MSDPPVNAIVTYEAKSDPSRLTTEALYREIANLEKVMEAELRSVRVELRNAKELSEQRSTSAERALEVAKTSLNEMRGMATDQQSLFLPKGEYGVQHRALEADMIAMESRLSALEGEKVGIKSSNSLLFAVVTVVLIAIGLLVTHIYRDVK